jgi:Caspase domain
MIDTATTPNKWALLIGIDKYKYSEVRPLSGCVNDVNLMESILRENFGFPDSHITVLRNEEATRGRILGALDQLVKDMGQDGIVVIHYSGHGSQMTDRENDEPDGMDETVVPHDSGRSPHPNCDITDDEIYLRLVSLSKKTSYTTLIFDCCHSGTISRDEEKSYEHQVGTTTHGALTCFLAQELTKAASGATYRDVFERASTRVTAAKPFQHPQMEGARHRELFGVRDIAPMRFVAIRQRTDATAILGAGAAHGMTVGSQWAVYSQAIKQVSPQTPQLGLVEITKIGTVTSEARVLEEAQADAIQPNARAVEVAHNYGEMRLRVDIHAPAGSDAAVSELVQSIWGSPLLRKAESAQDADVRAYLIAPRTRAGANDPIPQLGAVSQATCSVVGRDGRLVMPTHAMSEPGVASTLRANLEKVARYRNALGLRNVNENSPLKDKVELVLLRRRAEGTGEEAEPDEAGGKVVYSEGDYIAFRIVNNFTTPIYVSVLDFGLTGRICLLHPIEGASEKLLPGRWIEVGKRQGEETELYIPEDFPYVRDQNDQTVLEGIEVFKLFATTHEADFSTLTQESVRGSTIDRSMARGVDSPLGQLLDLALTGHGTRDPRRKQLPPETEWTTVECSFLLRR